MMMMILEVPMEDVAKDDKVDQSKHKQETIQQEKNQSYLPQEWRTHLDHPFDKVIYDISKGVSTRLNLKDACLNMEFVSQIETSKNDESL